LDLRGKRILVTGAARGLGRELTLLLDGQGCSLALVDRDAAGLDSLKALLTRPAQILRCDLGNFKERTDLLEEIKSDARVDILINCAGIGSHSTLAQLTVEEVERVMQVNALAPLELIAGLSPLKLVVNIGSVAGEMHLPGISLYAAGKSALHEFTRSISLEGARTLLVILGPLRGTDFARSIAQPRTDQPKWYRNLDLDARHAALGIVRAMKSGKSQLVLPGWYRFVFTAAHMISPLIKLLKTVPGSDRVNH
jgi:short-subunit dehydrogenase